MDTPEGPSGGWVWTFLRVVPMGWSWAFWLGQRANAHVCCSASGLGVSRSLTDHGPVPTLDGGDPCLLPFCDNINVVGTDLSCNIQLNRICSAWKEHGVLIHEVVEATAVFTSLGRLIDGSSGRVFSRPERTERLRQASLWLEQRPRVTGREVERYVGHLIDHIMLKREILSILRSLYDFVRDCYHVRARLWPSAAREVAQCRGL